MSAQRKQYKVISSKHQILFTGNYCDAMDRAILANNSIIVSVVGDWVIAKVVKRVFFVIDEPFLYAKPAKSYRNYLVTFTALESFYGAGNMAKWESCADVVLAKDRNHAMRIARQMWRDTNGGPFGVKAKISVKLA